MVVTKINYLSRGHITKGLTLILGSSWLYFCTVGKPKTSEFIIIGDRQVRESLIQKFPTQLLENSVSPTNKVKNLGVTFDSGNTFTSHITKVCHACYYHLN